MLGTLQRYNRSGTVGNLSKSGRTKCATCEAKAQSIAISLEENPHLPTTELANMHEISRRPVGRVQLLSVSNRTLCLLDTLGKLYEHIIKARLDKELEQKESLLNEDGQFYGTVNCPYWSQINPHWVQEAHRQYPQKWNVWVGKKDSKPHLQISAITRTIKRFIRIIIIPAAGKQHLPEMDNTASVKRQKLASIADIIAEGKEKGHKTFPRSVPKETRLT
ncbi:hypothetical protein ILUMI_16564 [Ignelater luminosus]|uniref:Uncharacterized protein n=1 Tax=Ignelater luminosus TaxID=2038154 RepID=A0A8K0CNC5_IGNLU|nr:hypothetical protein ILUMI_16564 [Ignelater luminosus]